MESLRNDAGYALRTFRKQPGFTAVALTVLALGIGANTVAFSIVDSMMLRPLSLQGSDRLVEVWREGSHMGTKVSVSPSQQMADAWYGKVRSFDMVAAYDQDEVVYTGGEEPVVLAQTRVTADLLSLLATRPVAGRLISAGDAAPGEQSVVMLAESVWRDRFGADPGIVGRILVLDEEPVVVAGVMPAEASFLFESALLDSYMIPTQLWALMPAGDGHAFDGNPYVLARLRPNVSVGQAQAELDGIQTKLQEEWESEREWSAVVAKPQLYSASRAGLWMVVGAAGFVLLIVCANLANMLLARGVSRGHELAVRNAIGASRVRIARQLLTENLILSLMGGTVGILLAHWVVGGLATIASGDLQALQTGGIAPLAVGFTIGLSLLTGLLTGLAPVLRMGSLDAATLINGGHRLAGPGSARSLSGKLLVTVEVVLASVLFLGAGLMVNSYVRLQSVDPGFDSAGLVTVDLALPDARYQDVTARVAFFDALTERVSLLPQVESATWARGVPPRFPALFGAVLIEGREAPDAPPVLTGNWVSTGYFKTLGMPLIEGRGFGPDNRALMPVIVNEALARRYFPDGGAIGQRIRLESSLSVVDWRTIVGITGNVRTFWLGDDPERMQMYFPSEELRGGRASVIVGSSADPDDLVPLLKEQVWALDPNLPIDQIVPVRETLSDTISSQRFNTLVIATLAATALLLAIVGVYGVVALTVSQRTREIGLRMALGARQEDVVRQTFLNGLKPVAIGIIGGLALSFALARFVRSLLFEVGTADPTTYVLASVLMAAAGVLACYLPARRATRIDPIDALRAD